MQCILYLPPPTAHGQEIPCRRINVSGMCKMCGCRQGFGYVLEAMDQLVEVLKARGPDKAVDIDNVAQRVALEVR